MEHTCSIKADPRHSSSNHHIQIFTKKYVKTFCRFNGLVVSKFSLKSLCPDCCPEESYVNALVHISHFFFLLLIKIDLLDVKPSGWSARFTEERKARTQGPTTHTTAPPVIVLFLWLEALLMLVSFLNHDPFSLLTTTLSYLALYVNYFQSSWQPCNVSNCFILQIRKGVLRG